MSTLRPRRAAIAVAAFACAALVGPARADEHVAFETLGRGASPEAEAAEHVLRTDLALRASGLPRLVRLDGTNYPDLSREMVLLVTRAPGEGAVRVARVERRPLTGPTPSGDGALPADAAPTEELVVTLASDPVEPDAGSLPAGSFHAVTLPRSEAPVRFHEAGAPEAEPAAPPPEELEVAVVRAGEALLLVDDAGSSAAGGPAAPLHARAEGGRARVRLRRDGSGTSEVVAVRGLASRPTHLIRRDAAPLELQPSTPFWVLGVAPDARYLSVELGHGQKGLVWRGHVRVWHRVTGLDDAVAPPR